MIQIHKIDDPNSMKKNNTPHDSTLASVWFKSPKKPFGKKKNTKQLLHKNLLKVQHSNIKNLGKHVFEPNFP